MDSASHFDGGTERPARWSLRLFDGFELGVLATGEKLAVPGKRERVLLAALVLSPKGSQPRRKLATLLWGDGDDETALDNLRTTIWRLRKALGDADHRVVASGGEDIVLDCTAFEVDALAFRRLAAEPGPREMELAANLYSGELLYGLEIENEEFESWRRGEAARYLEQAVEVLTRLMQHFDESARRERAIETGIRILQLEPLNEAVVRRLMRLYAASGRRGAAVQLYRRLADALRADLDAEPEAETRSAYTEIARGGEDGTGVPAGENGKSPAHPVIMARQTAVSSNTPRTRPRISGWIAAGGVAALMALVLLYQFLPWTSGGSGSARTEAVSIAVLPFVNLSGDDGQEFLSDGISEEITAALAKVPGLRVVARTSAFQFKGQNRDIQAIARQLHASHIIEGSVRKAGDRLRITAQLIEGSGGIHLWSESYDRQLTDIFMIQENIARTIAASLRVPLGLNPGENLIANRSIDTESYQQYLRAKALMQGGGERRFADATALLEQVVARNPDYAPAWTLLGYGYGSVALSAAQGGSLDEARRTVDAFVPKIEAAVRRAILLDPNLPNGYEKLGVLEDARGKLVTAEDLMLKALALDPDNPDVLDSYSLLLAHVGRLEEAMPIRLRLQSVEPFVPLFNARTATLLWVNGQNDTALSMFKALPTLGAARTRGTARIYATTGRYGEAADALQGTRAVIALPANVQEAVRLLRSAPAAVPRADNLRSLGRLGWVYLSVGAPEQSLEMQERMVDLGMLYGDEAHEFWHPDYAPVRKTERFKAFARKAGLVDYWRERGWPSFCRPVGADDLECE